MECKNCKFFLTDESGYSEFGWCNMRFPPHHTKNSDNRTHPTFGCDLGQPIPDPKELT